MRCCPASLPCDALPHWVTPLSTRMVMLACPSSSPVLQPHALCPFACSLLCCGPPLLCSHYVCVPQGMLPSDVLMTSPVIQGEGGAPVTHFSEFGGIDPTMDPELAAVRNSVSIVCTSIVVFLENNPLVSNGKIDGGEYAWIYLCVHKRI